MNQAAMHDHAPSQEPEITLYGMKLPNQAAVAAAVVETKLGEITDPDFLRYVKTLLGETVP